MVLNDPVAPSVAVEASGLLAGGQRNGSDPVTVTATDNAGVKRVEIVDVTTGTPRIVGRESYDGENLTDKRTQCSFAFVHACPNLPSEVIVPDSLEAGRRTLKVRVTDAADNVVEQGPYSVDAISPSNRGAFNGSSASDDGSMSARFTHSRKTRRTVGYNARARITGRLLNSSGRPISGARLDIMTRDLRQGARSVARGTATTGADGVYVATVRAGASRLVQVGWRSHVNDTRFQENAYVTLKARASARLSAPHHASLGHSVILSGRVRGTVPARGVAVLFQGRGRNGHYATFADGRANRHGSFRVRYHFRSGASRGHVRVPRQAAPRRGLPVRAGLLQPSARAGSVTRIDCSFRTRLRRETDGELLRHGSDRLHRAPPRGAPAGARGRHLRARARWLDRQARSDRGGLGEPRARQARDRRPL